MSIVTSIILILQHRSGVPMCYIVSHTDTFITACLDRNHEREKSVSVPCGNKLVAWQIINHCKMGGNGCICKCVCACVCRDHLLNWKTRDMVARQFPQERLLASSSGYPTFPRSLQKPHVFIFHTADGKEINNFIFSIISDLHTNNHEAILNKHNIIDG